MITGHDGSDERGRRGLGDGTECQVAVASRQQLLNVVLDPRGFALDATHSVGGGADRSMTAFPLPGSAWPLIVRCSSLATISAETYCAAARCSKTGELSGGVAIICIGLPQARSNSAQAA